MPIVSAQPQGRGRTPDGKEVVIPPPVAMILQGPRLRVILGPEQTIARQLQQKGEQLPGTVTGWALIDTGASCTCVDEDVAKQLQLPAVDVEIMTSASQEACERNVYPVSILVPDLQLPISASRAIGASLKAQDLVLLIGRDVLQACLLVYNGRIGQFTLSI